MDDARQGLVLAQLERVLEAYTLNQTKDVHQMTLRTFPQLAERMRADVARLQKKGTELNARMELAMQKGDAAMSNSEEQIRVMERQVEEMEHALSTLNPGDGNGGPPLAPSSGTQS